MSNEFAVSVNALFFPPPYETPNSSAPAKDWRKESDTGSAASVDTTASSPMTITNTITVFNATESKDISLRLQTTHPTSFRIKPRQLVVPAGHEADIKVRLVDPNPLSLAADNSTSSSVSSLRASENGSDTSSIASDKKKLRVPRIMIEWWVVGSEGTSSQQVILSAFFVPPAPNKYYNVVKGDQKFVRLPEVWPPAIVPSRPTSTSLSQIPQPPPQSIPPPPPSMIAPTPPLVAPQSSTPDIIAADRVNTNPTPTVVNTTTNPNICAALEHKLSQLKSVLASKQSTLEDLKSQMAAVTAAKVQALEQGTVKSAVTMKTTLSGGDGTSTIGDALDIEIEAQKKEVIDLTSDLDHEKQRLRSQTVLFHKETEKLDQAYKKWYDMHTQLSEFEKSSQQKVDQLELQIATMNMKANRDGNCATCMLM